MRTTLRLDDDVLRAARSLAESQDKTLGQVISDLLREALAPREPTKVEGTFPVFDVSDDAAPLTEDLVEKALDDGE